MAVLAEPTRLKPAKQDDLREDAPTLAEAGPVVALNEAGELFATLAEGIQGSAVGWSASALEILERKLTDRYGVLLGGEGAITKLVTLAATPSAA
ncbi:MAG: hypothetical protein ACRBK7_03135 [Acidimicrobiales bacterium]